MGHAPTPIDIDLKRLPSLRKAEAWGEQVGRWMAALNAWRSRAKQLLGSGAEIWNEMREVQAREKYLGWILGVAIGTGVALGLMLGGRRPSRR